MCYFLKFTKFPHISTFDKSAEFLAGILDQTKLISWIIPTIWDSWLPDRIHCDEREIYFNFFH